MRINIVATLAVASVASCGVSVMAQTAPDAGQTFQQSRPPLLKAPLPSQGIEVPAVPIGNKISPGGVAVTLSGVDFVGNTVFNQTQLQIALGDVLGKAYDLSGLRDLAERISAYYRTNGYPFAVAFLPAQSLTQGVLRIEVIEGRYGKVYSTGDSTLALQSQPFLSNLKSGDVIESAGLERATLNLFDLPGIATVPIIRPGDQSGTGDLEINLQRGTNVTGEVGFDNFGNRYTGQNRLRVNASINSPLMLGDQIQIGVLNSELDLNLNSVDYSAPMGGSGLRGQLGYAQTYYKLGKEFASADASGVARVTTIGARYPLIRSQQANIHISANWQDKAFSDAQGAAGTRSTKSTQSLPLALIFDLRDSVGGTALNYGFFSYTKGELDLDSGLLASDGITAKSQGAYEKANLDVVRLQSFNSKVNLYGRVSAQWADKNLDSSEKFGLGGSGGVRAYPAGEGFGDKGWFGQFEVRYSLDASVPYLFYDTGEITTNARPWDAGSNQRALSGGGLGLRYQKDAWNIDALVAWRDQGGRPTSDTSATEPLAWINLSYRF